VSDLLARAGELLGAKHTTYVVARVGPDAVETDARGTDVHGDVELGSISKGVTGLLWHDALARGEVSADATLGDHLEIPGPIGRVTLSSLATHSSGLPRLAGGSEMVKRSWELWRKGRNPYREDVPALLAMLHDVKLRRPGKPSYSNLGFQLIGAGWLTGAVAGHEVTWHNGGTGGFRSFVGIDRNRGTGIALVSASSRSVDGAASTLLCEAGST